MSNPGTKLIERWWGATVTVVRYRWPVLVLFLALCLPVDVSGLGRVSRVLIGVCLVVGFAVSLVVADCRRARAASEGHGGAEI